MWQFVVALVAAGAPVQSMNVGDAEFGPRQHLSCDWFSNFENSRFLSCHSLPGKKLAFEGDASLRCVKTTCAQLDVEARSAADWKKPEAVWGTFSVEFYGRVSLKTHASRHIGDGSYTVLVEDLVSVKTLPDQ